MPKTSGNRRKTRFVLRKLQGHILLQTTALPLAAVTGFLAAAAILGRRLLDEAALADAEMPTLEVLLVQMLSLGACMVGAILYVAYRFSHRVAGPAHQVIQSLERLGRGEVDFQVELRRGDLLGEVVDQLNATLQTLAAQRAGATAPAGTPPAESSRPEPVPVPTA